LIFTIKTTSDGELTITLPRALIDAKLGDADDEFFVLVNGAKVDFGESKTSSDRTLTIAFPDGAKTIEIIGTFIATSYHPPTPTPTSSQITVSTDRSSYQNVDTVRVSGFIRNLETTNAIDVGVVISSPNGNIVSIKQFSPYSDGTYQISFNLSSPLWKALGEYTVKVEYGGQSAKTTFYLTGSTSTPHPSPTSNLNVGTDKTSYKTGEMIEIKGEGAKRSEKIILNIMSNRGQVIEELSIRSTNDGSFSTIWIIPNDLDSGTYTIKVFDSYNTATTSFRLLSDSPAPIPTPKPEPTPEPDCNNVTSTITSQSGPNPDCFGFNLDKTTVEQGDAIKITGQKAVFGKIVRVSIGTPSDDTIVVHSQKNIWPNKDGSFSATFGIDANQPTEMWRAFASNVGIYVVQDFFIVESTSEPEPEPTPDNSETQITFNTYNKNYQSGDTIIISGYVTPVIVETPVTLQVLHGNRIVDIAQLSVSQDGTFTHTIRADGPSWADDGLYTVRAIYEGSKIGVTNFHFDSKHDTSPKNLEPKVDKVTICHYPPGNLDNLQTLRISSKALQTHLAHGDSVGECDTKYNPSIVSNTPNVSTPQETVIVTQIDSPPQETPIVTQIDSTPQDDDRIDGLIDENKKLREELDRQGSEIDNLNENVDYINEILVQFKSVVDWISSLSTNNLFSFFNVNSEFISEAHESPAIPPISNEDTSVNEVQEKDTSLIKQTPQNENVKIVGYDATDSTDLVAHEGTVLVNAGGVSDNKKSADERIAIYVTNDSVQKVTISELRFSGFIYTMTDNTNGAIGDWGAGGASASPASQEYVIVINPSTGVTLDLPASQGEIQPGQIVTIVLGLDQNIKMGRDVQFMMSTSNNSNIVGTITIGKQVPGYAGHSASDFIQRDKVVDIPGSVCNPVCSYAVVVACQAGEKIISGGYVFPSINNPPLDSMRIPGEQLTSNQYQVTVTTLDSHNGFKIQAHAFCLKLS